MTRDPDPPRKSLHITSANTTITISRSAIFWAVVSAIAILAIIPRLYFAGKYGLWTDEIGAARTFAGARSFGEYIRNGLLQDTVPPLYNVIGYLSTRRFSPHDFAFRLPAAIFSVLTVFPLAALARIVSGYRAGIFAALFAAFAPTAIRYGYDARPYSVEVFLISLLWLQLHIGDTRWSLPQRLTFPILCTLTCLSHYFALVAVGALLLLYLWLPYLRRGTQSRPPTSLALTSLLIFAATAAFHVWLVTRQQISRTNYFTDYTPAFLWKYFAMLWQTDVIGDDILMWGNFNLIPIAVAALAALGLLSLRRDPRLLAMSAVLLFAVIAIPLVAKLSHNLISIRFALFALPCLLLYSACGLAHLVNFSLPAHTATPARHLPLRLIALLIPAAIFAILTHDTLRALKLPYFHEWREKATYYDSLLQRNIVKQAVTPDRTVARNINFYTPHPLLVLTPDILQIAPAIATAPTAFFNITKPTVARLYHDAGLSSTLLEINGVTPKVIIAYPEQLTIDDTLHRALAEYSHMHRIVVPERRAWVYSQLAQISDRLRLTPLANLSYQLLFLNAENDIDRGFALWKMGSPHLALPYYENFFRTNPPRKIRDYMVGQYEQLQEELKK